ncbi:MAG: histidine kinase [Pseudopedobacter saltans]|uniref:Histidine kinase n=1 Tax=Pseudopedobacter saltans TaxID=151895 RepID=A0A2W5F686_9SPHI|nr:MAG: histidine kinase [Pseudopedobacter saltans]
MRYQHKRRKIWKLVQQKNEITLAFINDKSPILDLTCNDLISSGVEVLFHSENIEDGLSQLSVLKELPTVCIVDLDFYNKQILKQLQKLRMEYPTIKLIAHSDIDDEKVGKTLLNIGFSAYLLIGSDVGDFKNAIVKVVNKTILLVTDIY